MVFDELALPGMSDAELGGEARRCWYCDTDRGPWEKEHQLPVSRGGLDGDNVVSACLACNHLKGKLTLEEFRTALELRLGASPVVFAGEAWPNLRATPIGAVRTLAGTPAVVKLDPVVSERLDRAITWFRRRGSGRLTRKDAVSAAVAAWLDDVAAAELDGADFPADDVLPFEGFGGPLIIRPGEASKTPRKVWDREVTKVVSPVLEQARRAVDFLRTVGASTSLLDYVTGAVAARNDAVEKRYPQFGPIRSAPLTASSDHENSPLRLLVVFGPAASSPAWPGGLALAPGGEAVRNDLNAWGSR